MQDSPAPWLFPWLSLIMWCIPTMHIHPWHTPCGAPKWNNSKTLIGSLVILVHLFLTCCTNSSAPNVLIAIGTKTEMYLAIWGVAVTLAGDYFQLMKFQSGANLHKCQGTVTSHARHFPFDHGMRLAPSGLFLSSRNNAVGSLIAWTPALWTALQIMLLSSA